MKNSTTVLENSSQIAREAKALVALAFRNGPIENVHAGKACPTCHGKAEYSHITQGEMRQIMKAAVNQVYRFLLVKEQDRKAYQALLYLGERYTKAWDEPLLSNTYKRHTNAEARMRWRMVQGLTRLQSHPRKRARFDALLSGRR